MAIKIKLLRASSLEALELAINHFVAEMKEKDARVQVDLVGGVTQIDDSYVATIRLTASHKLTFEDVKK